MTVTTEHAPPAPVSPGRTPAPRRRASNAGGRAPYAFIAPFYVLYAFFMIAPIGAALYLSLTEWVGLGSPRFVGLVNYVDLASDTSFRTAFANTALYVAVALVIVVPGALLIAQALNTKGLRLRDLFRVTFFIPMVLSPIVIALVFGMMLDTDFGAVNSVLFALFGTPPLDWLADPTLARLALSFVIVWRWVGYLTIFFLAALQNVPAELYEAAELDGAGPLRRFQTVTLPAIRPVTAFVFVTSFIAAAQLFDEPYLLTRGGPGEATLSVSMFVYRAAFERQQFGYAAAAGVVLFVVVFAVSRVLNRILDIGRA
ncbi:carbohydrate ABC transporter permease [Litorihabitans aurantiacus]|uniref:Sugar transporter n=1 Tax=Litorihabitans aurantiacus TaxID=1930061 RepID=A0AA37XHK1_9MICO|nr:sugar ABC transporter permease [Litorihabitans aurantiacus]GMA33363.1 sugar transporter [Litorihabitans aurantiacus]